MRHHRGIGKIVRDNGKMEDLVFRVKSGLCPVSSHEIDSTSSLLDTLKKVRIYISLIQVFSPHVRLPDSQNRIHQLAFWTTENVGHKNIIIML